MNRKSVILHDRQQAPAAMSELWQWCKQELEAGRRLSVKAQPVTRSEEASAKFHAMCADFERSGIEWAGKKRSREQWKILLISGHTIATKADAEITYGLEREVVSLRESSAQMGAARMASLIEYTNAMAVELGVKLSAPDA